MEYLINKQLENRRKLFSKKSSKTLADSKISRTFASAIEKTTSVAKFAEIAQLVEHNLAKVRVASSSLVFRSKGEYLTSALAQVAEW